MGLGQVKVMRKKFKITLDDKVDLDRKLQMRYWSASFPRFLLANRSRIFNNVSRLRGFGTVITHHPHAFCYSTRRVGYLRLHLGLPLHFVNWNNRERSSLCSGIVRTVHTDIWREDCLGLEDRMSDQHQKTHHHGKRPFHHQSPRSSNKRAQKKARKRERDMNSGSVEEVLGFDVRDLRASLGQQNDATGTNGDEPTPGKGVVEEEKLPEQGSEIEVEVVEMSSTGEGLAVQKGSKWVYVVPFVVPGDVVKVKTFHHQREEGYTVADFVSVVKPSPSRDDSRIGCKYFAACSGCQFQMLDYAEQLRLKKRVVEKAFRNFSQLPPELIPTIQDTIGSPLQYGYRTKLTPHFDAPSGWKKAKKPFDKRPDIGFMQKGKRTTIDIEDCPIGTDVVRLGMKLERERMKIEYNKYTRGATILLRESTRRISKDGPVEEEQFDAAKTIRVETDKHIDLKTYITDNNATSTEYIGDYIFRNPAGSFFQNNNSILPVFTDYIRDHVLPPPPSPSPPSSSSAPTPIPTSTPPPPIKYLIDAYSGSGLFTITLSSLFEGGSMGIDIAESSIAFARRNAEANGLSGSSQASFIAADAGELFKTVTYDPDQTVVILDPPRKGCDADFLGQLLRFGPRRVVYVSCNVHTQARDVGILVRGEAGSVSGAGTVAGMGVETKRIGSEGEIKEGGPEEGGGEKGGQDNRNAKETTKYEIESLRGFDFFPQTHHVEGVAVLNRVDTRIV